jgi:hypothetical protein
MTIDDPKDKMAFRVLAIDPTNIPDEVTFSQRAEGIWFVLNAFKASGSKSIHNGRHYQASMPGSLVVTLSCLDPNVRIPLPSDNIVIMVESPGMYLLDYSSRYRHTLPDGWEAIFNMLLDSLEKLA